MAKRLNVSLASMRRWRLERRGPAFVKVGALVRYRPEDLDAWLRAPDGRLRSKRINALLESRWSMTPSQTALCFTAPHNRKCTGGRNMVFKQKNSNRWWYKFVWNGELIGESTKQTNKRTAEQMEAAHKAALAKGEVGIRDKVQDRCPFR